MVKHPTGSKAARFFQTALWGETRTALAPVGSTLQLCLSEDSGKTLAQSTALWPMPATLVPLTVNEREGEVPASFTLSPITKTLPVEAVFVKGKMTEASSS